MTALWVFLHHVVARLVIYIAKTRYRGHNTKLGQNKTSVRQTKSTVKTAAR
jgi:hypothetical protein